MQLLMPSSRPFMLRKTMPQAECIAALAEQEVGFLKALNVHLLLDYLVSLSSLGS